MEKKGSAFYCECSEGIEVGKEIFTKLYTELEALNEILLNRLTVEFIYNSQAHISGLSIFYENAS